MIRIRSAESKFVPVTATTRALARRVVTLAAPENSGRGYWFSLPWRCRFRHAPALVEYREIPDYPWIVTLARECARCGTWLGFVEDA